MRVLGLMSGTSADGIDVALARISGAPPNLKAKLEHFAAIPYPSKVREAILRLANGASTTTAEISQLNFLSGSLFAECGPRGLPPISRTACEHRAYRFARSDDLSSGDTQPQLWGASRCQHTADRRA